MFGVDMVSTFLDPATVLESGWYLLSDFHIVVQRTELKNRFLYQGKPYLMIRNNMVNEKETKIIYTEIIKINTHISAVTKNFQQF